MSLQEELAQRGIEVTRRTHDTNLELVADFGPGEEISVEIVDETVIVASDEETYDIDIVGDAQAFIKNGILTIEVNEEAHS